MISNKKIPPQHAVSPKEFSAAETEIFEAVIWKETIYILFVSFIWESVIICVDKMFFLQSFLNQKIIS